VVPVYEFECDRCGARFEALVDAGTEETSCRLCGAPGSRRLLSAPAPPMRLVKSRGETRKQEERNRRLRERTKARFKEARQRAREARQRRQQG
jgi:putative FmdB family regulatory protein